MWSSLSIELAVYFSILDKMTTEDEFFVALRGAAHEKIFQRSIHRVGDMIAMSKEEFAERSALTRAELGRVETVLKRLGLSFGTDVNQWLEYRKGVADDFTLHVPYGTRLPKGTQSALLT